MAKKKLSAAQKKAAAVKAKKAALAAAKKAAAAKKLAAENEKYKPADYLRGDKNVGKKYTAWDTYNQGTPDLGAKAGPGDPYHEKTKVIGSRTKAKVDYMQRAAAQKKADQAALPQKTTESQSPTYVKPVPAYRKPALQNNWSKTNADFRSEAIRKRLQGVK